MNSTLTGLAVKKLNTLLYSGALAFSLFSLGSTAHAVSIFEQQNFEKAFSVTNYQIVSCGNGFGSVMDTPGSKKQRRKRGPDKSLSNFMEFDEALNYTVSSIEMDKVYWTGAKKKNFRFGGGYKNGTGRITIRGKIEGQAQEQVLLTGFFDTSPRGRGTLRARKGPKHLHFQKGSMGRDLGNMYMTSFIDLTGGALQEAYGPRIGFEGDFTRVWFFNGKDVAANGRATFYKMSPPTEIPEPATMMLLGSALCGGAIRRRRKQRNAS